MKNPSLLAVCLSLSLAAPLLAADLADLKFKDIKTIDGPAAVAGQAVASKEDGGPVKAEGVDLLPTLTGPCDRDQASIGSCHAFSAVAILEAAYYRKFKQKTRFSEADIFMRRTMLDPGLYAEFCKSGTCELSEGNGAKEDLEYAIREGVATSFQYKDFLARYRKYREAEEKNLASIQAKYEAMSSWEKWVYDPRAHWAKLQNEPETKKLHERLLRGKDPKIDEERAVNRVLLHGFAVVVKRFADLRAGKTFVKTAAECREAGQAAQELIVRELNAGRPVVVSVLLAGLPAWGGAAFPRNASHAIAIIGYHVDAKKGVVFKTRNSWGADQNIDVLASEACYIHRVVTVLTPEEAALASSAITP